MVDLKEAEKFEKLLNRVSFQVMVGAFLHKCAAWLSAGTITWATVVVMGGFASQVAPSDFVQVTVIVVEIAFLLALALFTRKMVTKKSLFGGSLDPVYLCYRDGRLGWTTAIQSVSVLLQFVLFILPCAYIAFLNLQRDEFKAIHIQQLLLSALHPGGLANDNAPRIVADLRTCLHKCASVSWSNSTIGSIASCVQSCFPEPTAIVSNLEVCLYTFFLLVLGTCILAFLCLIYITAECLVWRKRDLSLKKYHDEVMSRALHMGLVEANEFDAKEFFLQGLGEDLAIRNIAPLEVKKQNSQLVRYLLHHPKGVEMVYEGLALGDTIRQQTCANIVGFWAPRQNIERNTVLLSKLAEKLGLPGKTAEAAANSFSALAVVWDKEPASPLLRIEVACDGGRSCNVVERVVDLVLRRRLPTLQVYVRVLDSFFMSQSVCCWLASERPQKMKDIMKKLEEIVHQEAGVPRSQKTTNAMDTIIEVNSRARIKARTAFLAFSALDRLMGFDNAENNNAAVDNSQGTPIQGTPANQIGDGVISDAPSSDSDIDGHKTGNNAALNNAQEMTESPMDSSQDATNDTSSGTVNSDASSSFDNNSNGWPNQAKKLLLWLDKKLETQEFMWYTEAKRYKELCDQYSGEGKELGKWLKPPGSCKIRGQEYQDLE